METQVEVSAKTLQDAIIQGAEQLGVGIDEVDFDTLSEGGLFKKMKVLVKLKNIPTPVEEVKEEKKEEKEVCKQSEPSHEVVKGKTEEFDLTGGKGMAKPRQPRAERPVAEFNPDAPKFVKSLEFAKKLFELLGDGLTITTEHNDREFIIMVHGEDVSRLIGREGRTLSAINALVAAIAIKHNIGGEGRRVVVDIENYRDKRKETLVELGKRKAEWVKESGKTVKLEAMPARERVLIHTALQDMEGIRTYSEGTEPNRYLIIAPSSR